MLYLLQVFAYTAVMASIYSLFLRNRPLYSFARYYLLASAIFPLIIPLLQLPVVAQQRIQRAASFQIGLPEIIVNNTTQKVLATGDKIAVVWLIYGMVMLLFISWHLWNGYRLWQTVSKSRKEKYGFYTLITSSGYGPGSFGRYIFFPGADVNETILAHEQAHVRLYHSRDIIFLNLLQAVAWPNIFLLWIRKEIKEVHEFQADALVNANRQDYAQLLLCSVFNTRSLPEMHLFIIHPVKRRIMMLQKNGKAAPLKAALQVACSLCVFLVLAIGTQSCSKKNDVGSGASGSTMGEKHIKYDTVNAQQAQDSMELYHLLKQAKIINGPVNIKFDKANFKGSHDSAGIYNFVKKMPRSTIDYNVFINANIVYPEYAKKKGIEGRVIVRFVINEKGIVENARVVKSPDTSLSNEALRVINKMPAWIPGETDGKKVPVYFVMPIVFKL